MAHIMVTASTCYILIGTWLMLLHCVLLQNISLNSSILTTNQNVNLVWPGEIVSFRCITRGSSILAWTSPEYIRDRLEFLIVQSAGTVATSGFASAELIDAYNDGNQEPIIISQLTLVIQRDILNSSVTCHHVGGDLTAVKLFQLSNTPIVTGWRNCLTGAWVITCDIRDSSILAWESDQYIGEHGRRLEFLSAENIGTVKSSTSESHVFANLTASYHENGIQVLNSQLVISESHYQPSTKVTCVNVGLGTENSYGFPTNYNCSTVTTDDHLTTATQVITMNTRTTVNNSGGKFPIEIVTIIAVFAALVIICLVILLSSCVVKRRLSMRNSNFV